MRITRTLALFLTIIICVISSIPNGFTLETPSMIVYNKGAVNQESQLEAMINDNDWAQWAVKTSSLSSDDLKDMTHLVLYNARHDQLYTEEELDDIEEWFNVGGKTIWVSSDSDFFSNNGRITSANQILETIDSQLRAESASVRDPVNNADPEYRVLASPNTEDAEIASIVEGVETVLVSGPSPIVAYIGGEYLALEDDAHENIHVILTSRATAEMVDNTEPRAETHTRTSGVYCVMAMELIPVKRNIVIVSGESPFSQGEGIYRPEVIYRTKYTVTYPQQGAALVANLLHYTVAKEWAATPSETQNSIPVHAVAVLIGLMAAAHVKRLYKSH
jgi:hypothetical protein